MSKPKTKGHRRGGRNRQFFTGLTGLASKLDQIIDEGKPKLTEEVFRSSVQAQKTKIQEADDKRKRKAYARLKSAGLIPKNAEPSP